jgi:hypothetical protein
LHIVGGYAVGAVVGGISVIGPELVIRGQSDALAEVGVFVGAAIGIIVAVRGKNTAWPRVTTEARTTGAIRDETRSFPAVDPSDSPTHGRRGVTSRFWTLTICASALLGLSVAIPQILLPNILEKLLVVSLLSVAATLLLWAPLSNADGLMGQIFEAFGSKLWLVAALLIIAFFGFLTTMIVTPLLGH